MKTVKIVLIVGIALLVLLVAAVVVVSLPGVQQALVVRMVATEPGESLEMEYLRVGFTRTEAREVDFRQPDASYQVAQLSADLSVFDLLFRRQLRMGDVVVTGLVIDLSELEAVDETEPFEFEGLLRQMELPMPFYLDTIRAEGRMLLRGDGEEPVQSDFVLMGGGFAPDREGQLRLDGDVRMPGRLEALANLGVSGDLSVLQGARGRIERARLVADVSAWNSAGSKQEERLRADVLLFSIDDGEAYQARFGRELLSAEEVVGGNPESPGEEELDLSTLVAIDATFLYEEGLLQGRWEVDIDREQIEGFLGEIELPVFAAKGGGEFSYALEREALDLEGRLELAVEDLGGVAEELRELGGFTLNSRFDLRMDETAFHLDELVLSLRDEDGQDLVEARNFQPVRYNRETERLEGVEERLDLAELTIHGLPVEWANLFLQGEEGEPEMRVTGGNVTGQLLLSADAEGIFFRLVEPVQANGISVFSGEEPLLADLAFEADASGSFRNGRLEATVDPLRLYHREELLAAGSGTFDSEANQARGNLQTDLGLLFRQPVFADATNLGAGNLDLELALDLNARMAVELNGTARNLVTRDEEESLPTLVLQVLARELEENVWEMDVPVRVEGERESDLRLAGRFDLGEEISRFSLDITGERLVLDELLALGGLFGAPENDVPPVNERDEEPVWAGLEGGITVNVAEIQVQPEYVLQELGGELTVEAAQVAGALTATFLDSPVDVGAEIGFRPEEERPYVLSGEIQVPRLSAGELFRELQPDRPPTIEGLFVASIEIRGTGLNVVDLADRVQFQARLRSGGGIIRLLYTENPLAGLGVAAGVLGVLGDEARTVAQIADRLSNMPYDEVTIYAERDEALNFVLREMQVISPELHLEGEGRVTHREDVPLLEQPMQVELRLGARGPLERMLGAVRVLGDETDELGYRRMRRDFTISGTPAVPDTTVFYRILVDAVMRFVVPGNDNDNDTDDRPRIPGIPDLFEGLMREIRR